jgi:hypothetical protein
MAYWVVTWTEQGIEQRSNPMTEGAAEDVARYMRTLGAKDVQLLKVMA